LVDLGLTDTATRNAVAEGTGQPRDRRSVSVGMHEKDVHAIVGASTRYCYDSADPDMRHVWLRAIRGMRRGLGGFGRRLRSSGTKRNLMIESDNFAVLRCRPDDVRPAVKNILIDPPYNTGNNDFIYIDRSWKRSVPRGTRYGWTICISDFHSLAIFSAKMG
jgi:hypothetical protein